MELNKENLTTYMKIRLDNINKLRCDTEDIDIFNGYNNQMNIIELLIEEFEDIFD